MMNHLWRSSDAGIRELLKNENSSLADVVSHMAFIGLWSVGDQELVNFIIAKFDEVIEYAYMIREPANKILMRKCLRVMLPENEKLCAIIQQRTRFIEVLNDMVDKITEYPYRAVRMHFSIVLPCLFQNGVADLPGLNVCEYFTKMFAHLDIDPVNMFLSKFICTGASRNVKMLKEIKYCSLLIQNMFTGNVILKQRSQKMIAIALERDVAYDMPGALIVDDSIDKLVADAIECSDSTSFIFLAAMDQASRGYKRGLWKSVHAAILPHMDKFCSFVLNEPEFTKTSEACTRLVCAILGTTKVVTDDLMKVVYKLAALFFEKTHNSFLHNCFLVLIKTMLDTKNLTLEIVGKMKLCENIIAAYKSREENVTSSYWGQLRVISAIVQPFATKIVDTETWNTVVVQENKRRAGIIAAPYGGTMCMNMKRRGRRGVDMVWVGALAVVLTAIAVSVFFAREFSKMM